MKCSTPSVVSIWKFGLAGILPAYFGVMASGAHAQAAQSEPEKSWSVQLGLTALSLGEYEGAKRTTTSAAPILMASYKFQNWGSVSFDQRARGLAWRFLDQEDYAFGVSLGGSEGRVDSKDGTLFRPGSKRLRGMGEIKSGGEVSVFAVYDKGVPVRLQVTKGLGDKFAEAKGVTFKGHSGVLAEMSAEFSYPVTAQLRLSLTPSVTWADTEYTKIYFGVSATQASRSGFKAYKAKGGLKSGGAEISASYALTKNWMVAVSASAKQLLGDAADSPIVEKKTQRSFAAGFLYSF
jgi:MipA family protein